MTQAVHNLQSKPMPVQLKTVLTKIRKSGPKDRIRLLVRAGILSVEFKDRAESNLEQVRRGS
ncbi:MAG: hypothetical protein KF902_03015 [Phycisphaeraceae bacterium]|nr:hypothetical protein [Phycisphaeraceae bacterium]MCW5768601.1 hypothetical protein [Phycisphaeraceae bacterium]